MKRFLLFAGYAYYPSGGWNDFVDSFDTLEEALEHTAVTTENWHHIVDTATGTKVA